MWSGSWVACDLVSEMQMMPEQTVRAGDHSGVANIDESDRDGRTLPVLHLCVVPPLDRLRIVGSNGICKSGKSLRITGTPSGDAIKEMKCV